MSTPAPDLRRRRTDRGLLPANGPVSLTAALDVACLVLLASFLLSASSFVFR